MSMVLSLTDKNGVSHEIQVSNNGMINLTQLCALGDKRVKDFFQLKSVKDIINYNLLDGKAVHQIYMKGTNQYEISWVNDELAIECGAWISIEYKLKIYSFWKRYNKGDLTLIPEITKKYDDLNKTYTTVLADRNTLHAVTVKQSDDINQLKDNLRNLQSLVVNNLNLCPSFCTEENKRLLFLNNTTLMVKDNMVPAVQIAVEQGYGKLFTEGVAVKLLQNTTLKNNMVNVRKELVVQEI